MDFKKNAIFIVSFCGMGNIVVLIFVFVCNANELLDPEM
jgi:hypothetical protein